MTIRKWVAAAIGLAAFAMACPAMADVACVQQALSDLGFYAGKVDGKLSTATIKAAAILDANGKLGLDALTSDNTDAWCTAVSNFAKSPDAKTVSHLDTVSEPAGVLSPATQTKLWNAYKIAKECFLHPNYDPGTPQSVPTLVPKLLAATPWTSPFTKVDGAPSCQVGSGNLRIPPPIPSVKLDEAYGQRQDNVDIAATWFRNLTTYYRLTRDPVARQQLHQAVVDWAKANGLGKGIHVSWGNKPVDYQMMSSILSVLATTGEIADTFTPQERAIVGPWLNSLIKQSAASFWKDREDDKAFLRTYMALLWGLMIGDDRPVQDAIFAYKLAIHDMRPDGSWPIDSQRGGNGVDYDTAATSNIVMIAVALQQARGIDLFDYAVDGRSVHDAVDWVVSAIKDPGKVNAIYAIPCPDGGDRWGSIDHPGTADLDKAGFLLAYAERFPERDSSKFIIGHFSGPAIDNEMQGGAPACQFALAGGTVDLPPLVMPAPPPTLPKPQFVVVTKEELANRTGNDPEFNSLLHSSIKGGKKGADELDFNVDGDMAGERVSSLRFVINEPLGKTVPSAFADCHFVSTTTYDDGQERLVISFLKAPDSESWTTSAPIDCIAKVAPPLIGFEAQFLTHSFRDIAIGLVASGDVDALKHHGMAQFFRDVALGQVQVGVGATP